MRRLELNMAFDLKFVGEFNRNGTPRTIAKITKTNHSSQFALSVDTLQEMVDLWNAKHTNDKERSDG
jgi:hypothetical protein